MNIAKSPQERKHKNYNEKFDIWKALSEISKGIDVKPCHWISAPDGDLGTEWCPDCGYYKLRNLRHRDRNRRKDYYLDGGWRTEHDNTVFCEHCGVILDGSLTLAGAEQELWYYREFCYTAGSPADAHFIDEMISALSDEDIDEGLDIARKFIIASKKGVK